MNVPRCRGQGSREPSPRNERFDTSVVLPAGREHGALGVTGSTVSAKSHAMIRILAVSTILCLASWCAAAETKVHPGLMNPKKATEKSPEEYQVKVSTTKGDFVIQVVRKWSPNGADRFYNLVRIGFFKDIGIFRAIEDFMFQFGIHGDPKVSAIWGEATFKDDPRKDISNEPGYITFAKTGRPDSRTTQLFINLGDNRRLDEYGFTPFGRVIQGMDVVKKINTEYGENPREVQGNFRAQGNSYIKKRYPRIDFIKSMALVKKETDKAGKRKSVEP